MVPCSCVSQGVWHGHETPSQPQWPTLFSLLHTWCSAISVCLPMPTYHSVRLLVLSSSHTRRSLCANYSEIHPQTRPRQVRWQPPAQSEDGDVQPTQSKYKAEVEEARELGGNHRSGLVLSCVSSVKAWLWTCDLKQSQLNGRLCNCMQILACSCQAISAYLQQSLCVSFLHTHHIHPTSRMHGISER